MPERSNGAVSKTVVLRKKNRGFESPSLRIEFLFFQLKNIVRSYHYTSFVLFLPFIVLKPARNSTFSFFFSLLPNILSKVSKFFYKKGRKFPAFFHFCLLKKITKKLNVHKFFKKNLLIRLRFFGQLVAILKQANVGSVI